MCKSSFKSDKKEKEKKNIYIYKPKTSYENFVTIITLIEKLTMWGNNEWENCC